jgi:hypothetical protein
MSSEEPKIHAAPFPDPPVQEKEPDHKASKRRPFATKDSATRKKAKKELGPVRRLTKADQEKLAMAYGAIALGMMPYKPEVAMVIANQAEACAEAWVKVAEKNIAIRRVLVLMLETSEWGMLLAAHTPILIALAPDNVKALIPVPFAVPDHPPADDEEEPPEEAAG